MLDPHHIQKSKSIEHLHIMDHPDQRILVSATADQILRFWDLKGLANDKFKLGEMHCEHR